MWTDSVPNLVVLQKGKSFLYLFIPNLAIYLVFKQHSALVRPVKGIRSRRKRFHILRDLHLGKELNLWDLIENQQLVNKLLLVSHEPAPASKMRALCYFQGIFSPLPSQIAGCFRQLYRITGQKPPPLVGLVFHRLFQWIILILVKTGRDYIIPKWRLYIYIYTWNNPLTWSNYPGPPKGSWGRYITLFHGNLYRLVKYYIFYLARWTHYSMFRSFVWSSNLPTFKASFSMIIRVGEAQKFCETTPEVWVFWKLVREN